MAQGGEAGAHGVCDPRTWVLSLSPATAELLRRAELHQLEHQPLLPGARHPPELLHERHRLQPPGPAQSDCGRRQSEPEGGRPLSPDGIRGEGFGGGGWRLLVCVFL